MAVGSDFIAFGQRPWQNITETAIQKYCKGDLVMSFSPHKTKQQEVRKTLKNNFKL